jgi:intein-encoded DNA endonuclease-like protein
MTKPVLYDVDKETISNLYNSGRTQKQLAKLYNVSESSILVFMRKHNIQARPTGKRKKIELDKAEISRLYEEGFSIETIADKLGVCSPKVQKFMKEHNIKTRNTAGNRMKVKI